MSVRRGAVGITYTTTSRLVSTWTNLLTTGNMHGRDNLTAWDGRNVITASDNEQIRIAKFT